MGMKNDLVVETEGSCFLCLNQVLTGGFIVKHESGIPVVSESLPSTFCSLQALSRYLKIDMSKVFNQHEPIPQHLLEKVERSKLMAPLCTDCANLTERFTVLYGQLEKIQIEIGSLTKLIYGKMTTNSGSLSGLTDSKPEERSGFIGKREIAKVLRTEVIENCSRELTMVNPRVKIRNLIGNQVNLKTAKIKLEAKYWRKKANRRQKSYHEDIPIPDAQIGKVKLEQPPPEMWDCNNQEAHNYPDGDDGDWQETPAPSAPNEDIRQSVREDGVERTVFNIKALTKESNSTLGGKIKCHVCKETFSHKASLVRHHRLLRCRRRKRVKTVQCQICGKGFSQKKNLQVHLETVHLKLNEWACDLCGKKFNIKSNMNAHRGRIHFRGK